MSHHVRLLALPSITVTVAWQLLLVFCNVKVIQLLYCNNFYKGAHDGLCKWLCWEFWIRSQLCLDYILGPLNLCYDLLQNSF